MDRTQGTRGVMAQVVDIAQVTVGGHRRSVRAEPHHVCRECGQRRSRFQFRGYVKADRTHTLCFECYRNLVNQVRANRLWAPVFLTPLASALPQPARLTADRAAFYDETRRRLHRAQIAARHAVDGLTAPEATDVGAGMPLALPLVS